jgi:hypothetical protein
MARQPFGTGLRLLAVLLLGLGLAGTSGPLGTSTAQEVTGDERFSMGLNPPAAISVCVGQSKKITVTVARETAQTRRFDRTRDIKVVNDIDVYATVADTTIGEISTALGELDEDITTYTLKFDVKGIKAGRTKITFKSQFSVYRIPGSDLIRTPNFPTQEIIENSLTVTVKKCRAKVRSTQRWSNDNATLMGALDETEMNADDQGTFTGQGTITWLAHAINVFGCDSSISIDEYAPSQVDLTGQMDDSGHLTVQMNFLPIQDSVTVLCVKQLEGTTEDHYTVDETPAELSVSIPEQGGVSTQSQALVYGRQNNSLTGTAVVDVELEADEAATFQLETSRIGLGDGFRWLLIPQVQRAAGTH